MLKIQLVEGEGIDRMLKRYKTKYEATKVMRVLRDHQHFTKPSIRRRAVVKKAAYIQTLKDKEND